MVTDVDDATHTPELVVLSAMAHGTHPERGKVFRALIAALNHVDEDHATLEQLDVWIRRAVTATRIEDVLD